MSIIQKIIRSILQATIRFPIPILSSIGAAVSLIIAIHLQGQTTSNQLEFVYLKIFFECISGISLFTAFTVFAEKHNINASKKLGLLLLGISVLGLHYFSIPLRLFDATSLFVSRFVLFAVCFHLLVSLIAYQRLQDIEVFWQYNQYLFAKFWTAVLFSITLFAGLAGALLAVDKLFGFNISDKYYADMGAVVLIVFNTFFFFLKFPEKFLFFQNKREFKKWLRIFAQYILIPIVLVYMVILYMYTFKILMYNHYPKGWVCIPILILNAIGILTYLLIYPIRNDKRYKVIYLFSRYYFYTVLPLMMLYFISIVSRIKSYGITEDRYVVLVLGIWIVMVCIYILLSKIDNIIMMPFSLLVLLFLSAIGPWGMFQLSINNQRARLERNLKRNGMLNNHKLIPPADSTKLNKEDAANIQSILDFLNKRGAINVIHPWLSEPDQKVLEKAILNNDIWAIHAIFGTDQVNNIFSTEGQIYFVSCDSNNAQLYPIEVNGFKEMKEFNAMPFTENMFSISDSTTFQAAIINHDLLFFRGHDTLSKVNLQTCLLGITDSIEKYNSALAKQNGISVIDRNNRPFNLPVGKMLTETEDQKIGIQYLELRKVNETYLIESIIGYRLSGRVK